MEREPCPTRRVLCLMGCRRLLRLLRRKRLGEFRYAAQRHRKETRGL
jgi:hypothetical protein